ncbi:alpha-L-glutamate ligase, partial [Bacillus pacificus]|nr:alpha-L-glutamate ligase [Bacillus pacificus]
NQYAALRHFGIQVTKTIGAGGRAHIVKAAKELGEVPFITKHIRGGKGLGVQLFHSIDALEEYLDRPAFEEPIDGMTLIQQYIEAPETYIT